MPDQGESPKQPAFFPRRHDPLRPTDPLHPPLVTKRARILFTTVLTDRDREILRALSRNRVLTIELVEWAFFPPRNGTRSGPSSRAYARIARLHAERYIAEAQPPFPPGGGSSPRLLFIDRRGVEAISNTDGAAGARRGPAKREFVAGFAFHRHSLAVSQAWAALTASLRDSESTLARWVSESEARADHDLVEDPSRPDLEGTALIPDAYFVIRRPDGRLRAYFLEIDLGTEVLARVRQRISTYERYRDGQFFARYGMGSFTLVFVADSAARLAGIQRAARSVIGTENVERYLFGTLDALRPERILRPVWTNANGVARSLVA